MCFRRLIADETSALQITADLANACAFRSFVAPTSRGRRYRRRHQRRRRDAGATTLGRFFVV